MNNTDRKKILDEAGVEYPSKATSAQLDALLEEHDLMPQEEDAPEEAEEDAPAEEETPEEEEESAEEEPAKAKKEDKDFPSELPAQTQVVEVSGKEKKIGAFFIHRTEDGKKAALYNERGQRISPVYGASDLVAGSEVKGFAKIAKDCAKFNAMEQRKARTS